MEIWKPLIHNQIDEGYYLSTHGRIRYKNNEPYQPTYPSSNGYNYSLFVLKHKNDDIPQQKLFPVDELLGTVFIPIPKELNNKPITIKHIDGDNRNDFIINLKWIEDVEEWKNCTYPGVKPNTYEVSSWGNVRNKNKKHVYKLSSTNRYGYHRIVLINYKNEYHELLVHRLVAWEFCNHGDMFIENHVNHINGIKIFNHYKNLESISTYENTKHALLTGLILQGEKSPKAKLSNTIVIKICKLLVEYKGNPRNTYNKLRSIGINIPYKSIIAIKSKESWKIISDKYFSKDEYRIYPKHLTEDEVKTICELNLKYPRQCKKIKREAEKLGINISLSRVKHIVYKNSFKEISDKYF